MTEPQPVVEREETTAQDYTYIDCDVHHTLCVPSFSALLLEKFNVKVEERMVVLYI